MEHWPTPEVFIDPVDIPYVGTEDYDDGDFFDYPQRKLGLLCQPDKLSPPTSWMDPDQPVSFYQTWLFFGCVIEVFRVVGIKVKTSDFRRPGDEYIRTQLLPKFIQQWRDSEASRSDRVVIYPEGSAMPVGLELPEDVLFREDCHEARMETKNGRYSYIQEILLQVQACIKAHCRRELIVNPESDATIGQQRHLNPDSFDKVWLSIMALGYTLMESARKIYKGPPPPAPSKQPWGFSRILRERILKRGWCMGECVRFESDLNLDGLYYIGSVPSPRSGQCLDDCTLRGCSGKTFSGPYETQHCLKDCGCKGIEVNVDMVVEIIRRKKIPLISWDGKKMSVIEADGNMKYVAISHVWSDGMGNESKNALPECQLNRIQGFVKELYSVIRKEQLFGLLFGPERLLNGPMDPREGDPLELPVGFWMDTLCVPVQDAHKPFRKQAILQMRSIYEGAHRVVVIDEWIRKLDRKASVIEKAVRLYLSNWQHRLWTLQEGVFAQNLFFWFNDGPQTIDELMIERQNEEDACPGFYCSIMGLTLTLVPMFGSRLYFDKQIPKDTSSFLFTPLLGSIINRTTSRMEDETICMATLLPDMNLEELLSIVKTDEGSGAEGKSIAEARMESFLLQIGSFNQSFIFNDMPRLQSEGYGWAPASFLGQSGQLLSYVDRPFGDLKKDSLGLRVTFPGIHLPLLKFKKTDSVTRINVVVRRRQHCYPYTLILQPPAEHLLSNRLNADSSKEYALILLPGEVSDECSGRRHRRSRPVPNTSGAPRKSYLENMTIAKRKDQPSLAVLGLLDRKIEESGPIRIWHVTRATLERNRLRPTATPSDVVFGDWMKEQEWSVL